MIDALGTTEISTQQHFISRCVPRWNFSTQLSGRDLHKNGDRAIFFNGVLFFVKLKKMSTVHDEVRMNCRANAFIFSFKELIFWVLWKLLYIVVIKVQAVKLTWL